MSMSVLRVLELRDAPSLTAAGTAYCARLFAHCGAEVSVVQGPASAAQPATPAEETLALWRQWLDGGKQPAPPSARAVLLEECDLVIDGRSAALRRRDPIAPPPQCVVIDQSWFGATGPRADNAGSDFVCRAMAGLVKLSGPAEGPPVTVPDFQAEVMAGLAAFTAGCAGLYAGGARRLDVSVLEAVAAFAEYQLAQVDTLGPATRLGINVFRPTFPASVYRCRQGWIGVTVITHAQWQTCCSLLGMEALGHDPQFITNVGRMEQAEQLDQWMRPCFLRHSAQEWFALARGLKLPWVVVPAMDELVHEPVLVERGAFVRREHAGRAFTAPALPIQPQAGLDRRALEPGCQAAPGELPLAGLRIIDLSMGWAGPLATRQLADLGAEVIKIESCGYTDWWRGHDPRPAFLENLGYEKSSWFNAMNRNKLGVTLDLSCEEGRALVRSLVRSADAVVENYAPEVLPKFQLDYAHLAQENPALVMLSLPAFSAESAWSDVRAYGSTLEHACGLPLVTGEDGEVPTMNHLAYGDANGGLNGAAALMAALLERRCTGRGRHIDLPQVQAMLPLTAFWMIHDSLHGQPAPREGSRHPVHAPHGCFRCSGDDAWLALAVVNDAQWGALRALLGDPAWAGDPDLDHAAGRKRQEERIRLAVAQWCADQTPAQAVALLQAAGIPAGVVQAPGEVTADPQLQDRGFWQQVQRSHVGPQWQASLPFREHGQPYAARQPAPTLGQHSEAVLRRLCGIDADVYAGLVRRGVTGQVATGTKTRGRMRSAPTATAAQPSAAVAAR